MIMGDHRQEKEKKRKIRLARLDWDLDTGYRSAILTGRLD
jgi:hypothetical protein